MPCWWPLDHPGSRFQVLDERFPVLLAAKVLELATQLQFAIGSQPTKFCDRTFAITFSQSVGIDQIVAVTISAFRWRLGSLRSSARDPGTLPWTQKINVPVSIKLLIPGIGRQRISCCCLSALQRCCCEDHQRSLFYANAGLMWTRLAKSFLASIHVGTGFPISGTFKSYIASLR